MSNICERAVHINFDRDERELAPRDTFMVLTGPDPTPPSGEGRRVGDVYLCNVDPVARSFDGAWYFAGDRDGWKAADAADLRAHVIAHPGLANRILSISPDGTSVNWSKRDTIVRRERRARTLSRSGLPPTTPPPPGFASAPVSPQRSIAGRRPAPLDPATFVLPHPSALFPPRTPPSSPPRMRPPTSPQAMRTPATPLSPRHPTTPHSARTPMTPPSCRGWNSAWGSPVSPGTTYTPDTSREASPRSPAKYTVPQKRPGIPPPPAPFEHGQGNLFASLLHPLAPVHETLESADDLFAPPPRPSAFRPQAPAFVPRAPAPPAAAGDRREEARLHLKLDPADLETLTDQVTKRVVGMISGNEPTPVRADHAKIARAVDATKELTRALQEIMLNVEPTLRPSIEEEILRRPPVAAPSPSVTASSNSSATRS